MYNNKKITAIIVGAGSSTRMGFDKLFYKLEGKEVLWHSVNILVQNEYIDDVVLVINEDKREDINLILQNFTKPIKVVQGGNNRVQSVQNGVAAATGDFVAIHDAARPFASDELIKAVIEKAVTVGGAVPAVRVKDTVKMSENGEGVTADLCRDKLFAVQTPQVFDLQKYKNALLKLGEKEVTDDAEIFSNAGYEVGFSAGDYKNIKITTVDDLPLAKTNYDEAQPLQTVQNAQKPVQGFGFKIGHGYDVHKLVADRKLILGGVCIPFEKGLLGHSDADVLAHAVADALLGATALGDIGKHFPDNDDEYKNADSLVLLKKVCELVTQNGFAIGNVDATILCQAPKLATFILQMRENLAKAMGIDVANVSVKATTEEHLGFTGSGEGIATHCVCLLCKIN
ncbi:MAG: 2-C-methyl-D-erythritol 2,4-cyclodiphosphate synthase [Oscillospiraceae bacterium]